MHNSPEQRARHEILATSSAGIFLTLVGVTVLFGWFFGFYSLVQVREDWAPVQPNAALLFVLCGVALASTGYRRRILTFLSTFAVFSIASLTLLEYAFSLNFGIDTLLMRPSIVEQTSHLGRMAPNTALCFILAASAISLFHLKKYDAHMPTAAGSLGLIAFCVSFVALYGYAAGIEPAYGWGSFTRMAFLTALVHAYLGATIVWLGWHRQVGSQPDLEVVWFWIRGYAFVGVIVVALVSTLLGVLSLYVYIQEDNRRVLQEVVRSKAELVDLYARRVIETGDSLGEYLPTEESLQELREGKITRDELNTRNELALQTALSGGSEIKGMIRLNSRGEEVFSFGEKVPEDYLKIFPTQVREAKYYGPLAIDGTLHLLIVRPIFNQDDLSNDLILVSADALQKLLEEPIALKGKMKLMLGIYSEHNLELFEFGPRMEARKKKTEHYELEVFTGLKRAFSGDSGLVTPRLLRQSSVLAAYAAVPSMHWGVVATVDTKTFDAAANRELGRALLASLVLAVFGGFAILFVFRTLAKYSRILALRLATSNIELNRELVQREKNEEVLNRQEEKLRASLREKDVLLGEIHHRVKNNLQLVSTIFNLQRRRTDDAKVLELLNEAQSRVRSIALLHESLYRSNEFTRIDASPYFNDIVSHAIRSFGSQEKIAFLVPQENKIALDPDQAIACGLIVNELVTNSVKHAFVTDGPSRGGNQIAVTLEQVDDRTLELRIADNGVGMVSGLEVETSRTLGMRIVNSLCRQLKAEMKIVNGKGTTFSLTFPVSKSGGFSLSDKVAVSDNRRDEDEKEA